MSALRVFPTHETLFTVKIVFQTYRFTTCDRGALSPYNLGKTCICLIDKVTKRSVDFPNVGFGSPAVFEFSRETANILLYFLDTFHGLSSNGFRKVLRKVCFAFLTVPTEGDFCVGSLSEDQGKLILQLSTVRFLSEGQTERSAPSTTSSDEQQNAYGLSGLFCCP
jgi:hypothetical protein